MGPIDADRDLRVGFHPVHGLDRPGGPRVLNGSDRRLCSLSTSQSDQWRGVSSVTTIPFEDQKPGTSGLRKRVHEFQRTHYLENFVQAIFDTVPRSDDAVLVLGGDGRYHNKVAIRRIIALAAANGYGRIIVGQGGLLSTPAASNLIRKRGASGGIILSASHNPGGPTGDFGIKYNIENGGPAPEWLTDAVYRRTREITEYRIAELPDFDIDWKGEVHFGSLTIEIVDPVEDYAALMEQLFDFGAIRAARANGLTILFDAMHAVTGPYAREIFVNRLGFDPASVRNADPLEDFGGHHPDPNPIHAHALIDAMADTDAPELGAASDGDGDRNMIVGRRCYVTPSDSLAVLAANAHLAPGYAGGIAGIARSMPTSCAVDRVAAARGLPCFATPTGWKFFGTLLDAGKVTICGEESAGTGSGHVREKDGLWAILLWLNILAVRGGTVAEIMADHWQTYGRNYYARHDYENLSTGDATALIEALQGVLPTLAGKKFGACKILTAESFCYVDPVDGTTSTDQGYCLALEDGGRIVYRLSGTGTDGATLRVYLESYRAPDADLFADPAVILAPIAEAARVIAAIESHTGMTAPNIIT